MSKTFPDTLQYNLPKTGCDSHAHLVYEDNLPDLEEILQRAYATGIKNVGQIFLTPQSYYKTRDLFNKHPNVFFTIAIHPNDLMVNYHDNTMQSLHEIVKNDNRFKAIGETGLDFYRPPTTTHVDYQRDEAPKDMQIKVFREHLELARECDLPVVIHSRDAFDDTIKVLDDMNFKDYPLVWHCFCGVKEQIDILNARGWYISVPGAITYPANKQAREDLKYIPEDKLLIETDCPFLSPQGWRGKRNEPCLVSLTANVIAECRQEPLDALWTRCGDNARRIFNIKD